MVENASQSTLPLNVLPSERIRIVPLTDIPPDMCVEVTRMDADDDDTQRLKAMGVCVGRKVVMVKQGDPLIVRVWGTRLGVSHRLAHQVMVAVCVDHPQAPAATSAGATSTPAAGR